MKEIICKKCGSIYSLSSTRIIARDDDSIICQICNAILYSWSEAKIWTATLLEKKCLNHADSGEKPIE